MDLVIKGIFTTFCSLIIAYLIMGVLSASIGSREASTYIDTAVETIQASNYSEDVIQNVKESAAQHGYSMDVTVYEQQGNETEKYGYVELTYHFTIPLVGYKNEHVLSQYIR